MSSLALISESIDLRLSGAYPCAGAGFLDCIDLEVGNATWNNVGAGPLVFVP